MDFDSGYQTEKGVVKFKSAATPFFYNTGTVSPRKLKFGILLSNQISSPVMKLRRGWHSSKVLPHLFSMTLEPLVLST